MFAASNLSQCFLSVIGLYIETAKSFPNFTKKNCLSFHIYFVPMISSLFFSAQMLETLTMNPVF